MFICSYVYMLICLYACMFLYKGIQTAFHLCGNVVYWKYNFKYWICYEQKTTTVGGKDILVGGVDFGYYIYGGVFDFTNAVLV